MDKVHFHPYFSRNFVMGCLGMMFVAGLWSCGTDSPAAPTIKIINPVNNDTIAGPTVLVTLKPSNNNYDHIHVWLNTTDTLDFSVAAMILCCADTATIPLPGHPALKTGFNYIRVQAARADHSDINGAADSVGFYVK